MSLSYETFIEQIKELISRADNFNQPGVNADSDAFKDWRLEATELLSNVKKLGYQVNSKIAYRLFSVKELYSPVSASTKSDKFYEDLADTLREFRLILKNYEKYGSPLKSNNWQEDDTALEVKLNSPMVEKLTVDWIVKNVPINWWLIFFGILFAIFSIGFTTGQFYEKDFLSIKSFLAEKIKS